MSAIIDIFTKRSVLPKTILQRKRVSTVTIIRADISEDMQYVMKHGRDEVAVSIVPVYNEGVAYNEAHFFFPNTFSLLLRRIITSGLKLLHEDDEDGQYLHYKSSAIDSFYSAKNKLDALAMGSTWRIKVSSVAIFESQYQNS